MTRGKSEEDFKHDVFKVLKSEPVNDTNRVDLRIVKWAVAPDRTLEKRRMFLKEGKEQCHKMAGLTADDVQLIVDNSEEILKILRGK
jgi:hypothetical protein